MRTIQSRRKIFPAFFLGLCLLLASMLGVALGEEEGVLFAEPQIVADGGDSMNYQLARVANSQLAFDSKGTLHMTYWRGDEDYSEGTSPDAPSYVYYRSRSASGAWTPEVFIDDSTYQGKHVGGRHSTLAVDSTDRVWVAWHDHRNCKPGAPPAGGSWNDNIEIYADSKPRGGQFSASDVRLSKTEPRAHIGDNGMMARIAAQPTSPRLSVVWFDFHYSSGQGLWDVSDILLKGSDALGAFDPNESIDAMRLTSAEDRGGASNPETPSFWMPDIAVDASGTRHMVWGGGAWSGYMDLHYAAAPPGATPALSQTTVLASKAINGYYDPAHITIAPNGDVWVAYADAASAALDVILVRKPSGAAAFEAPVAFARPGRQIAPDVETDAEGLVHLVFVERRTDSDRDLFYATHNPLTGQWSSATRLTTRAARWERPSLALDATGRPFVLFEENKGNMVAGSIWLTFQASLETAVEDEEWNGYR